MVNDTTSFVSIVSSALSKKRYVNTRKMLRMLQRMSTASVGWRVKTNQERRSPKSDPIPYVILFRARIVLYSLGLACERMYPYVEISLISFASP